MLIAPRISLARLAELCRRVSMALAAGIDARTVWAREAERARGRAARPMRAAAAAVGRGDSLAEAFSATGDFFPPLMRELAAVGETTGHQAEVFAQLAEHYEHQLSLRRMFLAAIAWPAIQLCLALAVVGFLIWITGLIGPIGGQPLDILGFGLVGNRGLAIYAAGVAVAASLLLVLIHAIRRGWFWTRPLQRAALRVPVVGRALNALALARLAWSLHLTLNAGMDVRQALGLSLRSTRNARYLDQIPRIEAQIADGRSLFDAFRAAGRYPPEFLDALSVAEQSGKLVESLGVLARQYQDSARRSLAALTVAAGFAVWVLVAALIVALIFRLFSFYLRAIYDAAGMKP